MLHINNTPTTTTDIFQLISKFLSKMVESGVLKTFTFLYSENQPYLDKNLADMMDVIEDLKAILVKICAHIPPQNEPLMKHNTYHPQSSVSLENECVSNEENIAYSRHSDEFSFNEIHNTIERNIQLIAETEKRMCDNLDHSFSSTEIASDALKPTKHTMFSECSSINSLLKEDQNDFLQDMRFPTTEPQNPPLPDTNTVYYVQYDQQCENTLQNIDLDILNRSRESYQQPNYNERINPNFDRIFDDQFPENESLLESECWNDINLPSTEPMSSGMEIQASPFELTDLKSKMDANLEESLVSNLESELSNELTNTVSNVPAAYDVNDDKPSDDFDQNEFFCEHCGNTFNTKMKLKMHLKKKHNVYVSSENRCDQCGKMFKTRATLLIHMRIHSDIKPFKCPYCWRAFTQKGPLNAHIQIHTGSYKFSCAICEKRFPTQAKLNFHSKTHETPELQCDVCSKMFTTKQYLNSHKKSHFKPNTVHGSKQYSCTECSAVFGKKKDLLVHIEGSHPDLKFVCYFAGCSRSYQTHKKLADHVYKKHTMKSSCENSKKIENEKLHCTTCRKTFIEKSSYFRHNLLVHREKVDVENSFNCVHCDKRFTAESSLDDHLEKFHNAVHSKELNYSCSICGSLFYAESALKEHYKIHSDFSTHLCQTCGMVFAEKANFLLHQSVHDMKKDITTKNVTTIVLSAKNGFTAEIY
ncbi:zinc finger protein 813-like isoform X2 [Planococcus citri]|uniref:zinc finger protein 813-like isoform X2 n=1 Tax=Planococcus citri TaxID=170843 RepID=UPI0031F8DCFE